jgi:hypothetical protein
MSGPTLAEWLSGASRSPAAGRGAWWGCDYPGCRSATLRGSEEISAWRQVSDMTGASQQRVLLCPEHAAAWDEYVRQEYLHRYGGEPDAPVLHH